VNPKKKVASIICFHSRKQKNRYFLSVLLDLMLHQIVGVKEEKEMKRYLQTGNIGNLIVLPKLELLDI